MSLASPVYLLFLLAACLLYRGAARLGLNATLVLVAASLYFYATWNPIYSLPLLATATLDYSTTRLLARLEAPGRRRLVLTTDLSLNLLILAVFKYFNFIAANARGALDAFGWTLPPMPFRVAFAVGVSFYTFQSMSHVLDVYRRDAEPARSFLEHLAFASFFPTLLAGPITRGTTLLPQVGRVVPLSPEAGGQALFLIALGFFKKLVLADYLSVNVVDRVFELPGMHSAAETLTGVYAYAAQIYCDFSGYSDIAIGSALLLGLRLKDNFDSPYRAASLPEFWRRWHISLSTWLRDYLLFSLPGLRTRLGPYVNVVITFALGGLWHGASWNYVVWGLLHGIGLAASRLFESRRAAPRPGWRTALQVVATFHFVCLTWVFFRCRSFADALELLSRLKDGSWSVANVTPPVVLAIAVTLVAQWAPASAYARCREGFVRLPALAQAALLACAAAGIGWAARSSVSAFIYFDY